MSAREIIAEIEALPPEERAAVEDFVQKTKGDKSAKPCPPGVNPKIVKSADKIFDKYDDMFRKLAQ
jgi:hypothetical protein